MEVALKMPVSQIICVTHYWVPIQQSHQRCPDSWYSDRRHQRVSRCIEHLASSSTRILPPLSLITFVDCLSCLRLCLAFAILYILSSPSLVFNSWYICCNASPLAIATAFFVSLCSLVSCLLFFSCVLFLVHCLVDSFASF